MVSIVTGKKKTNASATITLLFIFQRKLNIIMVTTASLHSNFTVLNFSGSSGCKSSEGGGRESKKLLGMLNLPWQESEKKTSCIVGISIFGFKTYWKRVFALIEIQTMSNFKQFLQSETLNADNKKSYYKLYDVKGLRAFHKQAMTKQQIYDNMLARRSGMDYSQEIQFETSIVNMKEAQDA